MATFSFPGKPKYTKIGIFGVKLEHLATLVEIRRSVEGQQE
jgi:hypothetical protein